MKVVQPITITPDMVVESNLFETAPATYAAGTTYALGAYASVAGTLGEILIYKSLQAGNIGHTPSSSPTWWVYSSSTYDEYKFFSAKYNIGSRVNYAATGKVYESLVEDNVGNHIDGRLHWKKLRKASRTDIADYAPSDCVFNSDGNLVATPRQYKKDSIVGYTNYYGTEANSTTLIKAVVDNPTGSVFGNPTQWLVMETLAGVFTRWNPKTLYGSSGLDIVVGDDGYEYQIINHSFVLNINHIPDEPPVSWVEVSPFNKTAPFDTQTGTKAEANKEITFTIASGIIDTVGLIGVNADLAVITVRDSLGGTIVFQKTLGLTGGNPTNAWDYYFSDPTLRVTQTIVEGIPPFIDSHITVTLTGSGIISIGNLIIGKSKEIGLTEYGATAGILDFSTKTTNSFGETTFVKRGFKKTVNLRAFVDNSKLNIIQNNLYSIRATPCLWVGSSDTRLSEALVVYGFYKDFNTEISYPEHSYITIEIEGLI